MWAEAYYSTYVLPNVLKRSLSLSKQLFAPESLLASSGQKQEPIDAMVCKLKEKFTYEEWMTTLSGLYERVRLLQQKS